jgi:hypothetical protein
MIKQIIGHTLIAIGKAMVKLADTIDQYRAMWDTDWSSIRIGLK